ncbi:uncharacterized membrane protein HdeD (DUF308 family) [Bifidobacterium commune]|uniref:Uncharacterized membrane protein HdeD, DUF308 family n=1 Tax=Bifidobacterium commune TaxID=1505727 RepID=A0A1C4H3X7_9BIFI|nr:HdeD family acid-resistance protein [Bifidobacterium commune]MBB2955050.1 uncharacterized membrane protein HdeD (DUF308 family) [Bifidobacterium commune]SCC79338.1 Uncharacterized membrane protein HdeD, DUF308 family [Bifidobacterium commune]
MQDNDMYGNRSDVNAGNANGQSQPNNGSAGQTGYGTNGSSGYGPYVNDPNQNAQGYQNAGAYSSPAQDGQYQDSQNGHGVPFGAAGGLNGLYNDEWWRMNPFKLVEEWLPTQAKKTIRMVYGVVGVVAVLLGLALLAWPGKTLEVFAVVLGIYFLISGAMRVIGAIVENGLPGGWRVLDILVGLLLVIGGVIMLKNTILSSAMLTILVTLTVGIGWIMEGIMALVETWRLPKSGWAIFYSVISVFAGIVLLCSPFTSVIFLIIFTGCTMVIMGALAIIRAFRFGKA